ncbi:MAG: ribosome maturation factor RimM [Hyphomicrobium sp.]
MTTSKRRILLGEISGAHGIRGELLVRSYAGEPEDIAAYGPLEDEAGKCTLSLIVVRVTPKGVIARVEGVSDRTEAEKLKGVKLYVERAKLPEADDDEFYHADLVGLRVETPDGAESGTIVAVQNYGAGDLIEIRKSGSAQTLLVPLSKACVPTISLDRGIAVVIMPVLSDNEQGDEEPDGTGV